MCLFFFLCLISFFDFSATIELLSILPYPSMTIYMFMLKQVSTTFIKFFAIFILIIVAFTLSFCVVMKPSDPEPSPWKQLERDWSNSSIWKNHSFWEYREPALMLIRTLESNSDSNDTTFRNFDNPFTSFLKTLQMLSGEFEIDPYTLDSIPKQVLFLFFTMISFILFNLINGLAISDIALLKSQAEYLNLKQQIKILSNAEGVFCDLFEKIR